MDDVFGDSEGLGAADLEHQAAIHRRLGLLVDTYDKDKDTEKHSTEKVEIHTKESL